MKRLIFIFPFLLVTWSLIPGTAWSGDEDMLNPYTQFDPETGYFIPMDEQPVIPEYESTVVTAVPNEKSPTPVAVIPNEQLLTPVNQLELPSPSKESNLPVFLLLGVIILVAGLVLGIRKYRMNTM
jgi:hypothetical protein